MDERELKEMLSAIEGAGWQTELCDTPVPVSYHAVKCGLPAEMGEDYIYSDDIKELRSKIY